MIAQSDRSLTNWQKWSVLEAIQRFYDGLFDLSANNLSHVFAIDVAPEWRPSQNPDKVGLEALRQELYRLKNSPVQEQPIFTRPPAQAS